MSNKDRGQYPEGEQRPEQETLADQTLEAIVRSQQVRERSRRFREMMGTSAPESTSPEDN